MEEGRVEEWDGQGKGRDGEEKGRVVAETFRSWGSGKVTLLRLPWSAGWVLISLSKAVSP